MATPRAVALDGHSPRLKHTPFRAPLVCPVTTQLSCLERRSDAQFVHVIFRSTRIGFAGFGGPASPKFVLSFPLERFCTCCSSSPPLTMLSVVPELVS